MGLYEMGAPYPSLAIANKFIELSLNTEGGIEHMKLQKLIYFSYGWWLSLKGLGGLRLINEAPQIWKHGPVFNYLYHVLKVFGRQAICEVQSKNPFEPPNAIDKDDHDVNRLIEWVWKRYGHLSGLALSEMTHESGTAWHRCATESHFRVVPNTPIPDRYVFDEFLSLMRNSGLTDAAPQAITV